MREKKDHFGINKLEYFGPRYTLKIAGSNMDKPSHCVKFFNYIFNPTFGFVHV